MDLYVYRVTSVSVINLALPDYLAAALRRIGQKECYITSVVGPVKWTDTSLDCHFIFDALTERGRSPFYETTFTLKPDVKADKMTLDKMTQPAVTYP